MSKYKIHGLLEMMLHHCDIDKEQFLQMDPEELRALIDEKITGESLQVFALKTYIPDGKTEIELEFKIGDGNEIKSNVTVFKLLKMNSIYPVANPEKLSDKKGRVLPDLVLLKDGATVVDLAKEVHSDLVKGLLYAKDLRYNLRVPTNYQLRDRDVICLINASKK